MANHVLATTETTVEIAGTEYTLTSPLLADMVGVEEADGVAGLFDLLVLCFKRNHPDVTREWLEQNVPASAQTALEAIMADLLPNSTGAA